MKSFRSIGMGLVLMLAVANCADEDRPLTFEEFEAQAYREPDTGVYITNLDEMAESVAQLREVYGRYLDSYASLKRGDVVESEAPLIVNRVGGADDKYGTSRAANLNFCVSSSSFGSRYNTVVSAMDAAAGAWEATARVNFVHTTAQDGNCSRNNNSVWFNVRQVNSGGQFLARSFFPSSSRRSREVQIDVTSFGNISPYTLAGILRHELGHTLGFRHEHTRPEAGGVCFEDNNWRALTTYDSSSVMHYPQCNGTQHGDLVLTSRDQSGARSLYP